MQIITLIYSIILLFFYHPLYQNYTSLMNTSFSFFYYIWCVLLTLSLCLTFFKVTSLKKFIIFLSLFFFIGLILPYHKNYPIFSTLHVFIPLSCIIIALLFLAYLIKNKQKSEPILAHKIYLCFQSLPCSLFSFLKSMVLSKLAFYYLSILFFMCFNVHEIFILHTLS